MKKEWKVNPFGGFYQDESQIQRDAVKWFRLIHRTIALYLFSIPNGGKLGDRKNKDGVSIQAAIMVGEGMTEGVADLLLALPRSGFHGMFMETKTPVGEWKKAQKDFAARQIKEGYAYVIFRSQVQFEKQMNAYLNGTFKQLSIEVMNNKIGHDNLIKKI